MKSLKTASFHRTSQVAASALEIIPEHKILIFINIEIVEKLKYTNGLQLVTSFKSELLHRYFLFPFFPGTSILNIFAYREAAFAAVLVINEIELAPD